MSKIISTGSYLPKREVSNTEFIEQTGIDSSDEWIQQRTGIQSRHIADEQETVSDLAIAAAKACVADLDDEQLQQIQLIIVATMSSRQPTPSVASQVQRDLGIERAWSFDINGACSGFVMALEAAEKISRSYETGYTLVVGVEKMTDILNFEDRGTSILFGDGGGAILIENDGTGLPNYQSQMSGVPDEKDSIAVPMHQQVDAKMTMDGRDVFNFVLRRVIPSLDSFIQEEVGDFDLLVSHQANVRLLEMMAKKLKIGMEKVPSNIANVGNTSAGSIPILLDQLVKADDILLDGSQQVVFTGFGGGLSWGHITLKL